MSPGNDRARPVTTTGTGSEEASATASDVCSIAPPVYVTGIDRALGNALTDWWTSGALLAIQQLARQDHGFTVDHVLEMTGEPTDPHYVGAVMALAQRRGLIEPVGCKVGNGGRLVRVWWGRAE